MQAITWHVSLGSHICNEGLVLSVGVGPTLRGQATLPACNGSQGHWQTCRWGCGCFAWVVACWRGGMPKEGGREWGRRGKGGGLVSKPF